MAPVVSARGWRWDADTARRRAGDTLPRTRVDTTGKAMEYVVQNVLDIHSRRDSRGW